MKPIRLTHHAREQCLERGASEDEVKQAVINGSSKTAKSDRLLCRYNFSFGQYVTERDRQRTMKISYDPETDALYIRLIEGKHECRTLQLNEEITLNIGPDEKIAGIEILDATEVLGQGHLPDVTLENITLASAV
jgi:uncharacterized protein YuzE